MSGQAPAQEQAIRLWVRDSNYNFDILIDLDTLESAVDIGPTWARERIKGDTPNTQRNAVRVAAHRGWSNVSHMIVHYPPVYYLTDGKGLVRYTLEYGPYYARARRIVKAYLNNEITWHEGLLE